MRILFIIIIIIWSEPSFSQLLADYPVKDLEPAEYVVTYSLKYQEDSLNPNFIRQDNMLLFLGKNISQFLSNNSYVFENDMKKIATESQLQEYLNQRPPMPHLVYRIYKNFPKGKISFTDYVSPNHLKYEENLDLFKWQLDNDTTTINGYKAQKATCDFGGRSWVAWFSPEIPSNDGPYVFNGLPGLIITVYDTRNHYVFELVSIEKPSNELMIKYAERQYIETTKQGFFKAKDAHRDNILSWAKNRGFSDEEQQSAVRMMAEDNNPIELKRK
ncbi:MAG: GLPGLI family protein [Bacteroidales bacterium]|nr:GLPGLI family protein [Bacteroidales bacterium]